MWSSNVDNEYNTVVSQVSIECKMIMTVVKHNRYTRYMMLHNAVNNNASTWNVVVVGWRKVNGNVHAQNMV